MANEQQVVSTGTSCANYSVIDSSGVLKRMLNHACYCDECKLLDAQDGETLKVIDEYLTGKIDFDSFHEKQVMIAVGDLDIALNRFNHATNAKHGPVSLCDAVDFLIYADPDEKFDEPIFRRLLEQLTYGYEIRMREKHQWKLGGEWK